MHGCCGKSNNHKFKDLDARIDVINTSVNAPVIMDAFNKTNRVPRVMVLSRFKLLSQLGVYEGKMNPADHLDSYKNLMML